MMKLGSLGASGCVVISSGHGVIDALCHCLCADTLLAPQEPLLQGWGSKAGVRKSRREEGKASGFRAAASAPPPKADVRA